MPHDNTLKRVCNVCKNELPLTSEYWHRDKKAKHGFSYRCKECAKDISHKWYHENSEHVAQTSANWRRNNQDHIKEYRQTNADKIAQIKHTWRKNNPDKVKRHKSESQKRNRSSANIRSKRYRMKYPDKIRRDTRIRMHRRRNAPGKFTKQDVKQQYESQKGLCWWCGCELRHEYHIDHLIPITRNGTNHPNNIVVSCANCNLSRGNKLPHEWSDRLL